MRIASALAGCMLAVLVASCGMMARFAPAPAQAPAAPAKGAPPQPPAAATGLPLEKETLAQLDRLRAIKPATDAKTAELYNKQLEEAWKFFIANLKAALPILRRELAAELKKTPRNDFVLLDIGYFLQQRGEPGDRELARNALFALDPAAPIVRFNQQELFEFTHAVAISRDARILAFVDKVFLKERMSVRVPTHAKPLDDTLMCVYLYGAYGEGGEAWMKAKVADKALANKAIEVLIWIGSPASVPEVKAAMANAGRDYETFTRAATFMMKVAGPQGRSVMLGVKPENLDMWTLSYYEKIHGSVRAASYRELRNAFAPNAPEGRISDNELKRKLAVLATGVGKEEKVSPEAILDSTVPRDFLIDVLTRVRTRQLRRVSDEALAEVTRTDAVLNALRYREK